MSVSIELVKELRERTGAGIKECKDILTQTGGDIKKAIDILRERGIEAAAKKADREAREGRIEIYVHPGSRLAAMVEVNCETDFVARTDDFIGLCKDLALHIAAANPRYLVADEVTDEAVAESEQSRDKFIEETVLMAQSFVKNPSLTIEDLVRQSIAKLGENCVVRRFMRYEVGG